MDSRLPIGFSDFAQLRREGLIYVDKTGLVVDVIRSRRQVTLLPRPRRFGKTLNLTMLRAFFEHGQENAAHFEGLAVSRAGEDVTAHQGRHPVVFLSFKDVKVSSWEACFDAIHIVVADEIARHAERWRGLNSPAAARLAQLADGQPSPTAWSQALRWLCEALFAATGEPVVILVDEYDTPIHAGFVHGYYDQVIAFFRNFLSAGMKDNPHLFRGVISGILRVAKESIFSGLNNVAVHTVLSASFAEHFGFLEHEVEALAVQTGQPEALAPMRAWYNGYRMGSALVYNPWSVLCLLANPADGFRSYWINTASDEILRELLVAEGLGLHDDLAALIRGETIHRPIAEDIVLRDVRHSPGALWSFLLFSGYLTLERPLSRDAEGRPDSPLCVPNREVATVYRSLFRRFMESALPQPTDAPRRLARALLSGDAENFGGLLSRLMIQALSFHDTAGRRPEAVYQAFIVGLLVQLEPSHDVRSNRESGLGRYDVMVRPRAPGQPGAVLELKVLEEGDDPAQALQKAMQQVRDRRYAEELFAAGADPVWLWAAAFDGKRAWVEGARADG